MGMGVKGITLWLRVEEREEKEEVYGATARQSNVLITCISLFFIYTWAIEKKVIKSALLPADERPSHPPPCPHYGPNLLRRNIPTLLFSFFWIISLFLGLICSLGNFVFSLHFPCWGSSQHPPSPCNRTIHSLSILPQLPELSLSLSYLSPCHGSSSPLSPPFIFRRCCRGGFGWERVREEGIRGVGGRWGWRRAAPHILSAYQSWGPVHSIQLWSISQFLSKLGPPYSATVPRPQPSRHPHPGLMHSALRLWLMSRLGRRQTFSLCDRRCVQTVQSSAAFQYTETSVFTRHSHWNQCYQLVSFNNYTQYRFISRLFS